ncbi:MAG: hypothetical protein AAFN30_10540 [Actinomycetota bacterium]
MVRTEERVAGTRSPAPTTWWSALARASLAAPAAGAMLLVCLFVQGYVAGYAVHLCRWPATISCADGWWGWSLVPTWFATVAAAAGAGLAHWALRGRGGLAPWGLAALIIAFPPIVLSSGPRQLTGADLVLFGGYATAAVVLGGRSVRPWLPYSDRTVTVATAALVLIQLAAAAALPLVLAGRT